MPKSRKTDVSHRYDIDNPDATLFLASNDGTRQMLVICRAHGARHKLRIAEMIQRPGEPVYPTGSVRYLNIQSDVVFPMYAVTEFRPTEWNIVVRYDGGAEPVIYAFQDKEEALKFQSLVTGYDTAVVFEGVRVAVTYRRHRALINAFRVSEDPELVGSGELQLWRRTPRPTNAGPGGITRATTSTSLPNGASTLRSGQRVTDTVSLYTDNVTGQQGYFSVRLPPPLLVGFLKERGGYTMVKINS